MFFSKQLSYWLSATDWHYTILLSVMIQTVEDLPDSANLLVNDILAEFPKKPKSQELTLFINTHDLISLWFTVRKKPRIKQLNLQVYSGKPLKKDIPSLSTIGELAQWLHLSNKQLDYLADLWRPNLHRPSHFSHYYYQVLPKHSGLVRLIESPKQQLKAVQRQINRSILSHIEVDQAAQGFRAGKNCKTHALQHVGRRFIFKFDLSYCFDRITWPQVYKIFRDIGYVPNVAKYLTGLCTHRTLIDEVLKEKLSRAHIKLVTQRHLPQGAPTSPALSNIALKRVDRRLAGLAGSLELNYSRYADDMVFSGDRKRDWRFLEPLVGSICLEEGFELNYRKSQIRRAHQRQKITGVLVNQKINIDRRDYDRLKAILTNCIRYGIETQNHENHANFHAYLKGHIAHIWSLNHVKGDKLYELYNRL